MYAGAEPATRFALDAWEARNCVLEIQSSEQSRFPRVCAGNQPNPPASPPLAERLQICPSSLGSAELLEGLRPICPARSGKNACHFRNCVHLFSLRTLWEAYHIVYQHIALIIFEQTPAICSFQRLFSIEDLVYLCVFLKMFLDVFRSLK